MKKLSILLISLLAAIPMVAQNSSISGSKSVRVVRDVSFSDYAKKQVETEINQWQKRGEFEKVAAWQARVNETTRNAKIAELTRQAEQSYIAEQSMGASIACTLGDYDTENEVYLLRDATFGDLLVPVPIAEAPAFKQSWRSSKATPVYCIADNKLALASADFTLPDGKKYRYNNRASLNYTIAQADYRFDPIEIDAPTATPKGNQTIAQTTVAVGKSDVDVNIPQTTLSANKTFAVIISNENYTKLSHVPYATNDGKVFSEYCNKTLGLPASNIRSYNNATYGMMLEAMNDIRKIADAYQGGIKILFYYAGHGAPNENTQEAYLLPVDTYGVSNEACYSLSRLYKELTALNSQSVTVFLDACFSGASREGTMLASARGVAIKPKASIPTGNLVVFSAASDDETALPYAEKGHGLFTYYLLKKLQETKGNVTYGELGDYITTNVRQQSSVVNRKSQTPTVIPALTLADSWATMSINK